MESSAGLKGVVGVTFRLTALEAVQLGACARLIELSVPELLRRLVISTIDIGQGSVLHSTWQRVFEEAFHELDGSISERGGTVDRSVSAPDKRGDDA